MHHIESRIKIDGVFDVQSNSCFGSVDYRLSQMNFLIKEAYLPNYQHRGNWSMRQLYYQMRFVRHNGFIDTSSANMIINGAVMSQLVKNDSKKVKFVYDCTGGSVTSIRYNGMLDGNFRINFSHAADSSFVNMNFSLASSADEVGASVTSHLPTLNHAVSSFSKGTYTNST